MLSHALAIVVGSQKSGQRERAIIKLEEAFEYLKQTQHIGALTLFAFLRKCGESMDEQNIGDLEAVLPFTSFALMIGEQIIAKEIEG